MDIYRDSGCICDLQVCLQIPSGLEMEQGALHSLPAGAVTSLTFLMAELASQGINWQQVFAALAGTGGGNTCFLQSSNLLRLCDPHVSGLQATVFMKMWAERIPAGLPIRDRDSYDLSGKLPLALKALQLGIPADFLILEYAQAGGMCGRADGLMQNRDGFYEPVEVKGATEKAANNNTCNFKSVSTVPGTWTHLILIGRRRDIVDAGPWRSIEVIEPYLTFGYIHWDDFEKALSTKDGAHPPTMDLCVTQGNGRSQFSNIVKWVPGGLGKLTREWWSENIMPLPPPTQAPSADSVPNAPMAIDVEPSAA